MNLLRAYKLYKLGIKTKKEIIKIFDDLENRMVFTEYTHVFYTNYIFFMNKEGKLIYKYCRDTNSLYARYIGFSDEIFRKHKNHGVNLMELMNYIAKNKLPHLYILLYESFNTAHVISIEGYYSQKDKISEPSKFFKIENV